MKGLLVLITISCCYTNAYSQTADLSCIQNSRPFISGNISLSDKLVENKLLPDISQSNYTIEFRLYTTSSFPNIATIIVISSNLDSAFITRYDFVNLRRLPGKGWSAIRATSAKDTLFKKTTIANITDRFCSLYSFFIQHGLFILAEKDVAPKRPEEFTTDPGSTWIEVKYFNKFRQVIFSGSSDKRGIALEEIIRKFRQIK